MESEHFFTEMENSGHKSITTVVEIAEGIQIINLAFMTEMKKTAKRCFI